MKGENRFRGGGNSPSKTSVSSDTHSAKRERAEAEGALERRVSVSSPSGTEVPSGTPRSVRERARTEINFVDPPTLLF